NTATPSSTRTRTPTWTPTPPGTNTPTYTITPSGTPTPGPCVMSFSDVRPSDYFYEAVQYLYCHGVIGGYPDGTFRPWNAVTVGQAAKLEVLGFGIPIYVPPTPWFCDI